MRSLLFAPANRERFVLNFAKLDADAYCIDLEDGTPAAEKDSARAGLPALVARLRETALSGPLLVRINDPISAFGIADIEACRGLPIDGLMVPKVSSAAEMHRLHPILDAAEQARGRLAMLVVLIESVAGIAHARAIAEAARPGTVLGFGAEDFVTDVGGRRTPGGLEVLFARSQVVLAAKLCDLPALDQVVVEVRDDARFEADANAGRDLGYDGKMCLTPRQVALANAAFSPSPEELDFARRLIAAFEAASGRSFGAFDFEGRMVDEPLVKRARRIVESSRRP